MSSDNTFKVNEYNWSSTDLTIDVGFTAQEIDDLMKTSMATSTIGAQGSSYTISTGAGFNGTWGNMSNYTYSTANTVSAIATADDKKLHVSGDTEITGDLTVGGVSFKETIESINKRLAILQPNPEKLEQFEALRKAYEHYKTMEALCEIPTKKEDK
jgi:hypothetical protein